MELRGWALMRHYLEGVSLEVCLPATGLHWRGGATGRCSRAARGCVRPPCGGHVRNAWDDCWGGHVSRMLLLRGGVAGCPNATMQCNTDDLHKPRR